MRVALALTNFTTVGLYDNDIQLYSSIEPYITHRKKLWTSYKAKVNKNAQEHKKLITYTCTVYDRIVNSCTFIPKTLHFTAFYYVSHSKHWSLVTHG